jgi:hypothetical protein
MNINFNNYDCKEIIHLYLMCMQLPPKPNKCIIPFNIFIKCINNIKYKI